MVSMFEAPGDGRRWLESRGYRLPLFAASKTADGTAGHRRTRTLERSDGRIIGYRPDMIPRTFVLDASGVITAVHGADADLAGFKASIARAQRSSTRRLAQRN